jgi:hypothetical protein
MKKIMLAVVAMLAFAFYSTASQADITSLTVTGATISQSTGTITVTGTIVCTAGDVFAAGVFIIQVLGGHNGATLGESAPAFCSGSVDQWVAPNSAIFGSINNGDAQVIGQARDLTDSTATQQAFHQPVHPAP